MVLSSVRLFTISKKNISDHFYLDKISCEPSHGLASVVLPTMHYRVEALTALGFGAICIKTVVSMATDTSHRLTMGNIKYLKLQAAVFHFGTSGRKSSQKTSESNGGVGTVGEYENISFYEITMPRPRKKWSSWKTLGRVGTSLFLLLKNHTINTVIFVG